MRKALALLPALALLSACIDIPQAPKRDAVRRPVSAAFTPRSEVRQCLADLSVTRASFTPLPDQYYGAGCSTVGTVRLTSLRSDDAHLQLANLGPVACPLADTLAGWARFGVDRAARQILGSEVVRIDSYGTYACRGIIGGSAGSAGRVSEHGLANAVDIGSFTLANGRRIVLERDWNSTDPQVREFLRIVHRSACKRFVTTLGPDYNAAHRNHFHLDMGGRPLCR